MNTRVKLVLANVFFLNFFVFIMTGYGAPPASQTAGGITKQDTDIQKKKDLEKKIEQQSKRERTSIRGIGQATPMLCMRPRRPE